MTTLAIPSERYEDWVYLFRDGNWFRGIPRDKAERLSEIMPLVWVDPDPDLPDGPGPRIWIAAEGYIQDKYWWVWVLGALENL